MRIVRAATHALVRNMRKGERYLEGRWLATRRRSSDRAIKRQTVADEPTQHTPSLCVFNQGHGCMKRQTTMGQKRRSQSRATFACKWHATLVKLRTQSKLWVRTMKSTKYLNLMRALFVLRGVWKAAKEGAEWLSDWL